MDEQKNSKAEASGGNTLEKVIGISAVTVLSAAVIVTGFVFGREKPKGLDTQKPAETTVTTTVTTTAPETLGTTVTTTAPETEKPETSKETEATKPETSKQTEATKPETSKETEATKPETSKQTEATKTETSKQTEATKPETSIQTQATKPKPEPSGKASVEAVKSNSWEQEGKIFSQFEFIVKNDSSDSISGWTATVTFNGTVEVSDGWNCDYSTSGKTLTLKPVDYNSEIPAGSQVSVGLILKSDSELTAASSQVK